MRASWQQLVEERLVKPHTTSHRELRDLREVVKRDLNDAVVPGLSADLSFATAYNAALQLGRMVLACAGYRTDGPWHHQTTFRALEIAMGPEVADVADYFDACRRKRNQVTYDLAHVATAGEAQELIANVRAFRDRVEDWIGVRYPHLQARA